MTTRTRTTTRRTSTTTERRGPLRAVLATLVLAAPGSLPAPAARATPRIEPAQVNPKEPKVPPFPSLPSQPSPPDLPVEGESGRKLDPALLDRDRRLGDLAAVTHEKILWSARAEGNLASGPVVTPRGVVVGTASGVVQLLDPVQGTAVWTTRVVAPVTVRPGVVDDGVLAIEAIAGLQLLDFATGGVRRTIPLPDADVVDAIVVSSDHVAAATSNGVVLLYDAATLRLATRTRVPGSPSSAPLVLGERVIVAFDLGGVHAVNVADGRPAWSRPLSGGVRGAPVPAVTEDGRDLVVVAGKAAGVVAFDAADGREVWRHQEAGAPVGVTAMDGRLLATWTSRRLVELDPGTGVTLRSAPLGGVPDDAPTVASTGVLVARRTGILEILDAELVPTAQIDLKGALAGPPAVSGGTAYVGLVRRLVYRVRVD